MMMVNRKVGKGDLRANSKEYLIVLTCTSKVTDEGGRSWSKVADETARQRKGDTPKSEGNEDNVSRNEDDERLDT
jgi:hypothetical protein